MSSGSGTSTFVIRWINFLTMILAIAVVGFGIWMSTHHDGCRRSLTLPVLGLGGFIFLLWASSFHSSLRLNSNSFLLLPGLSIIGFLGALKNNSILLSMAISNHVVLNLGGNFGVHCIGVARALARYYKLQDERTKSLAMLLAVSQLLYFSVAQNEKLMKSYRISLALVIATCLGIFLILLVLFIQYFYSLCFCFSCRFIVTNNGSGHSVAGLSYKEYQLQDYSSWFLKQLNNTENWKRLKSCLVKADDCNNLPKKYKTLKQYKSAKLTPIEAGCCRPPSECGYPTVNASYYDLSFHPVSSNSDCKLYKNSHGIKCYNCASCKAGVAQYMKTEWRVVAIFNVVLFVVLVSKFSLNMLFEIQSMIYFVGCCARRNAARNSSKF
ncbi:hypothetical protein RJ641_035522 [Dillenia turbinata]|uniref:Tetraspanin-10 n=1 Tax=Dillenia turbinata TaxID=194707 RepID=A0AAN8VXQ3_9MAGN